MGIEKLIPNDFKNNEFAIIDVIWEATSPNERRLYSDQSELIIGDAIELGVITPLPPPINMRVIVSGIIDKLETGVTIVSIVKQPLPINVEFWCLDLSLANGKIKYPLQICHQMIVLPSNPLSLHWRYPTWATNPDIKIEGIEKCTDLAGGLAEYAKELLDQLPMFGKLFKKPVGGRPRGTGTPSSTRKELLNKAYQAINAGASWNSEQINRITNASKNTVIGWRKNLLRETMPIVKQLRQEGLSIASIAINLDIPPEILEAYIKDAEKLDII